MKRSLPKRPLVKLAAFVIAAMVAAFGLVGTPLTSKRISASVNGPAPGHTNAPGEGNCTACHVDFPLNSGSGSLSVSGLPANYKPGQQIPLTVTLSQADAVAYGFELTSIDNFGRPQGNYNFSMADPVQLQIVNGFIGNNQRRYIEHTFNGVTPTQFGTKSWNFTWTAPAQRAGKISFYAAGNAADSNGTTSGDRIYTTSRATYAGSAIANFDADGVSDISVFRPSNGNWYARTSSNNGFQVVGWGENGDQIVPGDYDGDGTTDWALWRPSNGNWYIRKSSGGFHVVTFGQFGDVPVPGDYDGDLKSDFAVWRPSTGLWYILSAAGFEIRQFGIATDLTAQADYDGDGKTDVAVFRPSNGTWYMQTSADSGFKVTQFGAAGDKPVQGDYDGDGKSDITVFRPSNSTWYSLRSSGNYNVTEFGIPTDLPAPADFDGDGATDIAVYRNGTWFVLGSAGPSFSVFTFGEAGDVPIPRGYISN
jgi:hypothetical protein